MLIILIYIYTALIYASKFNYVEIVKELLKHPEIKYNDVELIQNAKTKELIIYLLEYDISIENYPKKFFDKDSKEKQELLLVAGDKIEK